MWDGLPGPTVERLRELDEGWTDLQERYWNPAKDATDRDIVNEFGGMIQVIRGCRRRIEELERRLNRREGGENDE